MFFVFCSYLQFSWFSMKSSLIEFVRSLNWLKITETITVTLLIQICAKLFPKYCFWTFLGQIYGRGQVFIDFAIAKKKYNIWIASHLHQFASEIANLASDCSMNAFSIFLCHRNHFQYFIDTDPPPCLQIE